MNLSLAQCLNNAEILPASAGGKAEGKASGFLGLSFPSLLDQENKDAAGAPIQPGWLMPGQTPTDTTAEISSGTASEKLPQQQQQEPSIADSDSPRKYIQGDAVAPVSSGTGLILDEVQNTSAPVGQQTAAPVQGQPLADSGLPGQGVAQLDLAQEPMPDPAQKPAASPLKLQGVSLTGTLATQQQTAQLNFALAGQSPYRGLDGRNVQDLADAEKWRLTFRHMFLRSSLPGSGAADQIQAGNEVPGRPLPATTSAEATATLEAAGVAPVPVPVSPLVGSAAEAGLEGSPAPEITDLSSLGSGSLANGPVQTAERDTPAADSVAETYRPVALRTAEGTSVHAEQQIQNQAAQLAGLAPLQDSLSSARIAMANLVGESGKTAEQTGPDLPSNIRAQILNQVASRLEISPDRENLTITLEPEHLGKVEVQLVGEKDHLTIVLKASGQEAEQALQKGIKELTENILDRTQRWQHVEVRIETREAPDDKGQGRQQERRDSSRQQEQEARDQHTGRDRGRQTNDDGDQAWGG